MAVFRKYMVTVYAKLVIGGTYVLDESEATGEQKVVPEIYVEAVSEWLAKREERLSHGA